MNRESRHPLNLQDSISRRPDAGTALLPNVVLAGVRKCGTTSVFEWLSCHPQVCASPEKGTEFLLDRNSRYLPEKLNYHELGLAGFARCFPHYRAESVILDATTRYYDQQTARQVLSSFEPQPRVVFLLREPADRLLSTFYYLKNNRGRLASDVSFSQFVAAVAGDFLKMPAPDWPSTAEDLMELRREFEYGVYADFLLPWQAAFAPDHLKVYLLDDLKRDPSAFMQRLAVAIGIDPAFYDHLDRTASNPSLHLKWPRVHSGLRAVKRALVGRIGRRTWLHRAYAWLQRAPKPRLSAEDASALARLRAWYAPSNRRLAEQFCLDLSAWEVSGG